MPFRSHGTCDYPITTIPLPYNLFHQFLNPGLMVFRNPATFPAIARITLYLPYNFSTFPIAFFSSIQLTQERLRIPEKDASAQKINRCSAPIGISVEDEVVSLLPYRARLSWAWRFDIAPFWFSFSMSFSNLLYGTYSQKWKSVHTTGRLVYLSVFPSLFNLLPKSLLNPLSQSYLSSYYPIFAHCLLL